MVTSISVALDWKESQYAGRYLKSVCHIAPGWKLDNTIAVAVGLNA